MLFFITKTQGVTTFPTGAAFLPSIIAFRDTPVHFRKYSERIGIIGGQLKYVSLLVTTTMQRDQPSAVTQTMYDYMEDFMEQRNAIAANAAPGVANGYHCDGGVFSWMFTQKGLVTNVFQGLAICFPAAFVVMLVATHNLYLSVAAIVTVAGIVGCVLGMCKFYLDWGLGVAESVAICIEIDDFRIQNDGLCIQNGRFKCKYQDRCRHCDRFLCRFHGPPGTHVHRVRERDPRPQVSRNDGMCTKNNELCTKSEELCTKTRTCFFKMMGFAAHNAFRY